MTVMAEKLSWWDSIWIWIKRATGIRYRKFPPPRIVIYAHEMDNIKVARTKAEVSRQNAEELENTVFNVLRRRSDSGDN